MRSTAAPLALALAGAFDAATAARRVVAHLAAEGRLAATVYVPRGGCLRCIAHAGSSTAPDGLPLATGPAGRAYSTGAEVDVGEAVSGLAAVAWLPLRDAAPTVGVLKVESRAVLRGGELERLRACAAALGRRLAELGGIAPEPASSRLLAHLATMASLDDADAIARAIVNAALDVLPLGSAVLVRSHPDGRLAPTCATGPLARRLMLAEAGYVELARAMEEGASCRVAGAPAALGAGAAVLAAAQLAVGGEITGILVVASGEATDAVTTDDLELLEHLAAHGAACLRTAALLHALRERAATDPLTGLGHHATFHAGLAASHRRPATAILVCDIDGFKRVNDTHGHAHGDRVLQALAEAMSEALRRGDRLYRIGGDEFAALLVVESEPEALDAAVRLRDAVRALRLGVTVSIGVAVPRDEDEPDATLLERADRALYRAKAAGRDEIALADDGPRPARAAG